MIFFTMPFSIYMLISSPEVNFVYKEHLVCFLLVSTIGRYMYQCDTIVYVTSNVYLWVLLNRTEHKQFIFFPHYNFQTPFP